MDKGRFLAVFDFDHTISDEDTFFTVHEKFLGKMSEEADNHCVESRTYMPYEQQVFDELYVNGVTSKQIRKVIESIPSAPGLEDVLQFLKEKEAEVVFISDSNSVFIQDWLRYNRLEDVVYKIYTNPAYYDEYDHLHIEPYHVQDSCQLSNINLCKGDILEHHIRTRNLESVSFSRVAYFGDGSNDMCPSLRLSKRDLVFPREGFSFSKMIRDNADGNGKKIKANTFFWDTGKDILNVLYDYINS